MIVHKIANGHVRDYHSTLIGKLNIDAVLSKKDSQLIEDATYEILHNDENWEADFELEADRLNDQEVA
jgi:sulfate adenylyltransferase subunit 1 (EFTu-like GTPase family)